MGTSAGASSGRRTPPGVTPEESSLPQGFMPTTTRRGLHSTAGTLRAVRGALVALFFLRGRARGLVFGAPRSFRVIFRSHVTRRLHGLLPPAPPRCCGCLRFVFRACSYRCLYGVMPRAAGGVCVGAVAPCISPGGWFALKISRARCSRPPARRGLYSAAGTLRAVSGALVALFFLRVRARGLVFSSLGEEWLCGRRAGAVSALLRHASCVAACLL